MDPVIEVRNLAHTYNRHTVYSDLNFSLPRGKVFGLLGKNGVGKTTLIKILMGFLRPQAGRVRVFGEDAHNLSPATRARIGLLFEGHLAYEFLTIAQIERFYAPFYPRWNRDVYYDLVGRLRLPVTHKIGAMSCGQRSQVVLGLIMAQQPELLLLDDYSMGLDAGYRRLFLDYMREYLEGEQRTVLLTSHVIQDLDGFVDEVIFLERGGLLRMTSLREFRSSFGCYRLPAPWSGEVRSGGIIKNVEIHAAYLDVFSFAGLDAVRAELDNQGVASAKLTPVSMSLEDAFIGYTGRY